MKKTHYRFPLVAASLLLLLFALWTGLGRLAWNFALRPVPIITHGPLMISGFLGTLIGIERAVALNKRWVYVGPILTALGGIGLVIQVPGSPLLITIGSLGLVAVFAIIVHEHTALYTVTMALGALTWAIGNVLWLAGLPIPNVVLWWAGFLILTIAGERLELSRLLTLSRGTLAVFTSLIGLHLVGLIVSNIVFDPGVRLTGISWFGLSLWLLTKDIARKTVRKEGLTRFIAICLLSGYIWLAVGGIIAMVVGGVTVGTLYDAMLHAVFVGFVMSMIFGHAPIIFPSILNVEIPFTSAFYSHLILLHLSLVIRIAGDLAGLITLRQWGGLLNVITLLLFLANTVASIIRGKYS